MESAEGGRRILIYIYIYIYTYIYIYIYTYIYIYIYIYVFQQVNQFELHVWNQQREAVEYCRENGIVIMSYWKKF